MVMLPMQGTTPGGIKAAWGTASAPSSRPLVCVCGGSGGLLGPLEARVPGGYLAMQMCRIHFSSTYVG